MPKPASPVRDLPGYLKLFQTYTGWRMYLVLALTLLAALAEGFGIVMLLPLLQPMFGEGSAANATTIGSVDGAPAFLSRLLDALNVTSVPAMLAIIGGAFLVKGLITFAAQGYAGYMRIWLMREHQANLFDAYSRMDFLYYVRRDTGHFINIITSQMNGFSDAFGAFVALFTSIVNLLSYFGLAILVAWRFGLAAVGIGGLLLLLFRWLNAYVRALSRRTARENGHLTTWLIQFLQAFKYLTATGQAGHLRGAVTSSIVRLTGYEIRQVVAGAFTQAVREPVVVFFIIATVLVQISILRQPLAPIMVSIVLFHRGLSTVLGVQSNWQTALNHIGSAEAVRIEFEAQVRHREPDGTREIAPLTRSIEFHDVTFGYNEGGDVLQRVSLVIPARTTVALVGESGAGKSTLIDMLSLLLIPRSGQVLIDGVPGSEIKLASWRRQIGYVSQETVIFDDSVANNICLWEGDVDADPELFERVRDAARRAHIADFIESLPETYGTRVGDRGVRLSGGQRQRLFIARELFRQPRLLILDEATSALDSESEGYIQQSIDAVRGKMTVVIIAHRLSTIRSADEVFVLHKGRLVEHGPYAALRDRRDSKFAAMVASQSLHPTDRNI